MSRGRKSNYPHRPDRKGKPKSSSSGGGKRRSWVSLVTEVLQGRDVSPRQNKPWWQAPIYQQNRLRKWAS